MKRAALLDLLSAHADDLINDRELAVTSPKRWLAARGVLEAGHLLELLQLAQAIGQALSPTTISAAFRARVGQQLLQGPHPEAESKRPLHLIFLLAATAVGLMLFLKHRLRWSRSPGITTSTTAAA